MGIVNLYLPPAHLCRGKHSHPAPLRLPCCCKGTVLDPGADSTFHTASFLQHLTPGSAGTLQLFRSHVPAHTGAHPSVKHSCILKTNTDCITLTEYLLA